MAATASEAPATGTVCLQPRPFIQAGDLVIIYEDFKHLHAVYIAPPKAFSGRYGSFPHSRMLGQPFGSRMKADGSSGGYVYLLSPSPELWTEALPHRTQILYIADISMICLQLELLPGSIVVEAGTGSGSLSHALARSVGPSGTLHTFEFNAQRAQLAKAEFEANGISGRVVSRHGDVCAEGFSYADAAGIALESVDGFIFDLPQPWDAVRRAAPYIKPGGRMCTFSPCIEQVARTLDVLRETGFTRCEVLEVITRTHEVRQAPPAKSDALMQAVEAGSAKRKAAEEEAAAAAAKDAAPTDAAPPAAEADADSASAAEAGAGSKRSHDEAAAAVEADADGASSPPSKRQKEEGDAGGQPSSASRADGKRPMGGGGGTAAASPAPAAAPPAPANPPNLRTRPYDDMRGHTGFLVFCSKHVG